MLGYLRSTFAWIVYVAKEKAYWYTCIFKFVFLNDSKIRKKFH